jgi:hypothetical protein
MTPCSHAIDLLTLNNREEDLRLLVWPGTTQQNNWKKSETSINRAQHSRITGKKARQASTVGKMDGIALLQLYVWITS